ncbi:MAG TPA: GtrA family protein [Candidatus Salinicoccus stercoripullorum]|uniref:GtrA family protein n=1 Tax=Candidatus Salinicoccus stercoripullorum TaxID=2838756 RepID=A0A9D1QFU0_9STAP|nr:GtrA family protein [Candidatus Salinicoccus stercoripullorum]
MRRNDISSEFTRFILTGLLNTLNYYVIYMLLLRAGLSYLLSHVTGFLAAFVISYFLNCLFVYRVRPTWSRFLKFPLTQMVNMAMQTLLLYIFVDTFRWNEIIAPLPVLIVTVPVTYTITRWVLKDKEV